MSITNEMFTMDGKAFVAYPAVRMGNFFIIKFSETHIRTYQIPKDFDMNKEINLSKFPYTDSINLR